MCIKLPCIFTLKSYCERTGEYAVVFHFVEYHAAVKSIDEGGQGHRKLFPLNRMLSGKEVYFLMCTLQWSHFAYIYLSSIYVSIYLFIYLSMYLSIFLYLHASTHTFFFLRFFWCGPFLKSLLNLLQYCFCFMFWFFWPQGMWDLSSLTGDQTRIPCIGRRSLNHWTTREVPIYTNL